MSGNSEQQEIDAGQCLAVSDFKPLPAPIGRPEVAMPVAPMPPPQQEAAVAPAPVHNGAAFWIKVSAQQDGAFTVTNSRNAFTKTYRKPPMISTLLPILFLVAPQASAPLDGIPGVVASGDSANGLACADQCFPTYGREE